MQRICTTARKEDMIFAYLVAIPRQRSAEKHFLPNGATNTNNGRIPDVFCDFFLVESLFPFQWRWHR